MNYERRHRALLVIPAAMLLAGIAIGVGTGHAQEKPSPERIDRLIRQLGDPSHTVREDATEALRAIGQPAVIPLRAVADSADPEIRNRVRVLLSELDRTVLYEVFTKKEAFPSPYDVVCSPDGTHVFVSFHTALELGVLDATTGKVKTRIGLKGRPAGLAVSLDGTRVFVACASPEGQIAIIDTGKCEVMATVAVGHTPTYLALSSDGKRVYCCNRFSSTVSVIDADAGKETRCFDVAREPVACVATLDGKTLLVAHHLPLGPSTAEYVGAAVSALDLGSGKTKKIDLPNGATGVRGICLSPDGVHAYVAHTLGHYQLPVTQIERGWANTNALSIVKVADLDLLNTVLLDEVDRGAANPWGVTCSENGTSLCVTHAGTNELSIINRKALHERLDQVASGKKVATSLKPADVPLDLHFLKGVRQRVALAGIGPRGVAVRKGRIWVAEYFSDSLSVVDATQAVPSVQRYQLGEAKMSLARRGEMLFNDATLCFQSWHSCATCHPDGRSDGIHWDLLGGGIGNPKNTSSLVFAHKTPPVMRLALRRDVTIATAAHFKYLQQNPRSDADLKAVNVYLESLRPLPSPALVNRTLSSSALRGKKVFGEAGCRTCHAPPAFTSQVSYKLGLGKGQDAGKAFDAPALVEVWRTGPYLHDGRAATLKEIFTRHNPKDKHGATSKLTAEEMEDLLNYVRSL